MSTSHAWMWLPDSWSRSASRRQTSTASRPFVVARMRFRRDMGGLMEAYQEVARRLGLIIESEQPERSRPKLVKTD